MTGIQWCSNLPKIPKYEHPEFVKLSEIIVEGCKVGGKRIVRSCCGVGHDQVYDPKHGKMNTIKMIRILYFKTVESF